METKNKSVWSVLSAIDCNDKVEKKNGLTYLSWAWAWGIVKKHYPSATYVVHEYEGKPYLFDETLGYMVKTSVTIDGDTIPMHLPVMDGANKAQKNEKYTYKTKYGDKIVEAATMFDINTAIMRCLTKNLAMFGMGHYIYAGEDIPEVSREDDVVEVAPKPVELIELNIGTDDWKKVVTYIKANKQLGVEAIGKQLTRKYKISASLKKEIAKLVSDEA